MISVSSSFTPPFPSTNILKRENCAMLLAEKRVPDQDILGLAGEVGVLEVEKTVRQSVAADVSGT